MRTSCLRRWLHKLWNLEPRRTMANTFKPIRRRKNMKHEVVHEMPSCLAQHALLTFKPPFWGQRLTFHYCRAQLQTCLRRLPLHHCQHPWQVTPYSPQTKHWMEMKLQLFLLTSGCTHIIHNICRKSAKGRQRTERSSCAQEHVCSARRRCGSSVL